MKTIFSILKKMKWKAIAAILISIGIVVSVPFVIDASFDKSFDAGDMLGYVGTGFTFVGTIVLGILALIASIKANKLSQKVTDLEEDRNKLETRPFALVTDWKAYRLTPAEIIQPTRKYIRIGKYNDEDNTIGLALELTNTSMSHISISFSAGIAESPEKNWSYSAINQTNLKIILAPDKSDEFVFYARPAFMKNLVGQKVKVELILENRFSHIYKETFFIIITALSDQVEIQRDRTYCHVHPQEYEIYRSEKDNEGKIIWIKEDL